MIILLCCLSLASQQLFDMSHEAVDGYLKRLHAKTPDFGARVSEVLRRSVGTPYVGNPLGEGPNGPYDKEPQMDLAHVDCVTFVEQTIALAASDSYQSAFEALQRIRYKGGEAAFEKRNHFMIADWIVNNRFCRDVSPDLGVPTAKVTRKMGRKHFYESKNLPDLAKDAVEETLSLTYVPCAEAARAEAKLPSPALILFIGKIDWLFTLHCGIFVRDEAGKGHLYNASSTEKKVVYVDFAPIFEKSTRYLGFTAYAIGEPRRAHGPS